MQAIALSLFRHIATLLGASLTTQGAMTGGEVEAAVGALVTLASIAWAVFTRRKEQKEGKANGR
jgi:drug/metabolite transporter superfamily protein YnfA